MRALWGGLLVLAPLAHASQGSHTFGHLASPDGQISVRVAGAKIPGDIVLVDVFDEARGRRMEQHGVFVGPGGAVQDFAFVEADAELLVVVRRGTGELDVRTVPLPWKPHTTPTLSTESCRRIPGARFIGRASGGLRDRPQPDAKIHTPLTMGSCVQVELEIEDWVLARHAATQGFIRADQLLAFGPSTLEQGALWSSTDPADPKLFAAVFGGTPRVLPPPRRGPTLLHVRENDDALLFQPPDHETGARWQQHEGTQNGVHPPALIAAEIFNPCEGVFYDIPQLPSGYDKATRTTDGYVYGEFSEPLLACLQSEDTQPPPRPRLVMLASGWEDDPLPREMRQRPSRRWVLRGEATPVSPETYADELRWPSGQTMRTISFPTPCGWWSQSVLEFRAEGRMHRVASLTWPDCDAEGASAVE